MEYVYASMALHAAGKEINEANLKKVLEAVGVQVDTGRVKALVAALEGVNIEDAIKEAAMMPVAAQAAAPVHVSAAPQAKKEEKKSEEEAAGSLAALFG